MATVEIHYHRPPDREELYRQALVHRSERVVVTLMERTPMRRPLLVDGEVALEAGSPVVWFTFPGAWHDIGRFHRADGTFTGIYANILTPVEFLDARSWRTTDLFLDVWVGRDGTVRILDEDEFDEAVARGWLTDVTAERALAEARALAELARKGAWPPPEVAGWTLERAREAVSARAGGAARGTRGVPPV